MEKKKQSSESVRGWDVFFQKKEGVRKCKHTQNTRGIYIQSGIQRGRKKVILSVITGANASWKKRKPFPVWKYLVYSVPFFFNCLKKKKKIVFLGCKGSLVN